MHFGVSSGAANAKNQEFKPTSIGVVSWCIKNEGEFMDSENKESVYIWIKI